MVIFLQTLICSGSIAALFISFLMLIFFEQFVALNKRLYFKSKYDVTIMTFDEFIYDRSYLIAVIFFVVGLFLMTLFIKYLSY